MKKYSIVLVIPYFGKLPSWFPLFLISAGKSKKIDFILFTDDTTQFDYPSNFKVYNFTFDAFKAIFKSKLGKAIYFNHPYKVCEYKSCYGHVLSDYISDYDFWGHCDIDLIFGDIDGFLDQIVLEDYDRIFTYGHFSLYKNNDKVNQAFQLKLNPKFPSLFRFSFVSRTSYVCNFDEVGINIIMKEYGFKVFEKCFFANVNEHFKKFRIGSGNYKTESILVYQNNEVFEIRKESNTIVKNELMYVHFQNRKKINIDEKITNDFLITDDGFLSFDSNMLEACIERYGKKETDAEQKLYYDNFKRLKRANTVFKLKREINYSKLRFFKVMYARYTAAKWLSQNKIK